MINIKGGQNSDPPCFFESDVSSELEVLQLTWEEGGMRPFQPAAASPRCATTSQAFGRNSILPSQQRWVNAHSGLENPIAEEFSGLVGRFPRSTKCPRAGICTPRNGVSPVRT